MRMKVGGLSVGLEPRFVEECVLLAMDGPTAGSREFRGARDALYAVTDPEQREARFEALHALWFSRLDLQAPLGEALREHPSLERSVSRCVVVSARSSGETGADLHEDRAGGSRGPALVIRLSPRAFLDRPHALAMLRHELMHVADMLDPEFAYSAEIPGRDAGSPRVDLLRQHYRVLWDTSIDGRLAARGVLPPDAEDRRRREFLGTFSTVSSDVERCFRGLFHGPRPSHPALWRFAAHSASGQDFGFFLKR